MQAKILGIRKKQQFCWSKN